MGLDKVESFLDDLRPSRNRTVTLGIMKLHQDATAAEQEFLNGVCVKVHVELKDVQFSPNLSCSIQKSKLLKLAASKHVRISVKLKTYSEGKSCAMFCTFP